MLDWSHGLALRAVADGDDDDSSAVRTLIATGLVEERVGGGYVVTAAGRAALDDDEPSPRMRIVLRIGTVCLGVLAVSIVIDWFT
jgi:hypothetical protein